MDVGQPVAPPLVAIYEAFVVYPEKMKEGRVEIVYVDRVFNNVVTKLVRFAVRDSTLYAAASKEN